MSVYFTYLLTGLAGIVVAMLVFMFCGRLVYDKLNALFVINTNIVIIILAAGFIDGRVNMYVDIAISYATLGFVTTVILAKYIGGRR